MKLIIRHLLFAYFAFFITQVIIGGLAFGINKNFIVVALILVLACVELTVPTVLGFLPIPKMGVGGFIFSYVVILASLYGFTIFMPGFEVVDTVVPELNILGYVLPSKHLLASHVLYYYTLSFVVVLKSLLWVSK